MTSSNGTDFRVTGPLCGEFTGPGEFPAQRPVTWSFYVFFDLRLNKWLSKQPWGWWFDTPPWSLWRQCNVKITPLMWTLMSGKVINSLTPARFQWNFGYVIFKLILVMDGWCISREIALRWMPLDLTVNRSTLVQVMAWCRQATNHHRSQCWTRSLSPHDITRTPWFKPNHSLIHTDATKKHSSGTLACCFLTLNHDGPKIYSLKEKDVLFFHWLANYDK